MRKSDATNGPQQQGQVMLYQATMAASSSSVQAPNVVYQDPMTQAHIDQLHEAVGFIPIMRFGSTGNNGGGWRWGRPSLGYHNSDGNAGGGGLGRAPVAAATGAILLLWLNLSFLININCIPQYYPFFGIRVC